MSPSTQHSRYEDVELEVAATANAGFTKLIEVLSHPRFQEYVRDELTVRVAARLREVGADDDQSVRTFINAIAYSYGETPKAINLLKMSVVQRCFLELVFDHSLPYYDRLGVQDSRWYREMLEHKLTQARARAGQR